MLWLVYLCKLIAVRQAVRDTEHLIWVTAEPLHYNGQVYKIVKLWNG